MRVQIIRKLLPAFLEERALKRQFATNVIFIKLVQEVAAEGSGNVKLDRVICSVWVAGVILLVIF